MTPSCHPLLALLLAATPPAVKPLHIEYRLRIDGSNLALVSVEMRLQNAPETFTLAAAAHAEYDDRYWRFVEDFSATDAQGRAARVTHPDSVLWQVVTATGGDVIVRYRVRLPEAPPPRAAWRAYLTPTGGVVGGPHMLLYLPEHVNDSSRLYIELPRGWRAVSGLHQNDDGSFSAPDAAVLMDSPVMVGSIAERRFSIDGVPHTVAYLRMRGGAQFDTAAVARGFERFARATAAFWGSMPYERYTLMLADSAYTGGLEHVNSATLGGPSDELARDTLAGLPEIAHEFFHTWNLMRIKPVEYLAVSYRTQPPVSALWFSEGLTLFYSDLLRRRAGLMPDTSSRIAHLESLIARYYATPGNALISAERASQVAYNAPPGVLGDQRASTHLQGELIGAMLDMTVRAETGGARSMDDVMRLMLARFATRGFTGADVQSAVESVCGCSVARFFDDHIRSGSAIDFNRYLARVGMRAAVSWQPARTQDGDPYADTRVVGYEEADGFKLRVWLPDGAWGRAGLHTGDPLVSINGQPMTSWPELRAVLSLLAIGDTARVVVAGNTGNRAHDVVITGYTVPVVHIDVLPAAGEAQRRLREAWLAGR